MSIPNPTTAVPLEFPPCAVCGGERLDQICAADEVRDQLSWLRRFHARRLKTGPSGAPPRAALEDRAEFTQHFVTNVVACGECGLLFRDPRPTAESIERIYAADHYGPARLVRLHDAQRELYCAKVRVLRRWLPSGPGVRVLEIGSFVGGFLEAAGGEGWTRTGVDPGEEVSAFCIVRGLPVVRATVEELRLPAASLDCVAIWNTFDQLPEPRTTLEVVARLLRPGGVLALRVPNGRCFRGAMARLRQASAPYAALIRATLAWNNLLGFPYLYGYSGVTLDRLLAPYGFARLDLGPDTLVRLSDSATRRWAAIEESVLKRLCRLAWALDARRRGTHHDVALAPWLDVYYRQRSDLDLRAQLDNLVGGNPEELCR